jgi:predicted CoA-substrate-specific enzyme activase
MITAGIDVGIETTKVVVLDEGAIVSRRIYIGGNEDAVKLGEKALYQAAKDAGLNTSDIDHIAATGIGDINFSFAGKRVPEVSCIARGIDFLLPSTRTALDLGAGKSLAVRCEHGKAIKIARNDKCASGTGKYLDIVAAILGIDIAEMTGLSLKSGEPAEVQGTCAVFAESEVISLVHTGTKPEDIARGALIGLARRVYPLLLEIGMEREVSLLGGVALNKGLVNALQDLAGFALQVPEEPQIVTALGAALIAREETT